MHYVIFTGSLALLSEAGHMLVEIGGFTLALFTINYTSRPPTPQSLPFGVSFHRIEILSSLVNSVVLILLSAYILYEGFGRALEPPEIQRSPMIAVAAVWLAVNFTGMRFLASGHSHIYEVNGESKKTI
jgi:cobalt-zinc-cadmium efflux system protein